MTLTCTTHDCERARVRRFGDDWFCLYHPYEEPPAVDRRTGRAVAQEQILEQQRRAYEADVLGEIAA